MLIGKGGAAFHLHLQMVVRIWSATMAAIPKLLKFYIGRDKQKPPSGIIICKALSQKALHTSHDMVGYGMKDTGQEHFQIVDHNVGSEDICIGMEQLAIHGKEYSKSRVMLT